MAPIILMVDDDLIVHRLYQPHIERAGWRMIGAANGREAIEVAGREKPQVIVMDIMMPEMDGVEAVLELKRDPSTKGIPVIVITSNPQYYQNKAAFTEAGAALFLPKPFGPAQLLQAIGALLPSAATGPEGLGAQSQQRAF